jgi:GTP cyclohydrolase IA
MSSSSPAPLEDPPARFDDTAHHAGTQPHRSERLRWLGPEVVPRPDLVAATAAAGDLLEALGLDLGHESMARTPERMATALVELMSPRPFEMTTFPNDGGYDELIVARGIPVHSLCEHHMLPFVGTAHVGYLPGQRILGLSKLARVVEHFARRPQVQERLTVQIANWLDAQLGPAGVGVLIEAEHLCMTVRGVQATGTTTVTSSLLGALRDDPRSRSEFLALAHPTR